MDVNEDGPAASVMPVYTGTDPSFIISLVPGPTAGSALIGPDGNSIGYDPGAAFQYLKDGETAADSFDVAIDADGTRTLVTYSVAIAGANDAPVATQTLGPQNIRAGAPFTIILPDNLFADVDGDQVTLSLAGAAGAAHPAWLSFDPATLTLSGTAPPDSVGVLELLVYGSDGSAAVSIPLCLSVLAPTSVAVAVGEDATALDLGLDYRDGDPAAVATIIDTDTRGAVSIGAGGALIYTPNGKFETLGEGERGQDSFTVSVVANGVTTLWTYAVDVAGANDTPTTVSAIEAQSVRAGTAISFTLPPALFTDIDGDTLVLSLATQSGDPLPAWLSFDAATGIISGTPPAEFAGVLEFAVVADDRTASARAPFILTVTPRTDVTLITGENDFGVLIDPEYRDGDPAAIVTVDSSGTAGKVSVDPEGNIRYEPSGAFETLGRDDTGHDSFTLTVEANGVTKTWTYTVAIDGANDAPVAMADVPDQFVKHGNFWSYTVPADQFSDIDGDPLTYFAYANVIEALPSWMSFDAATRTFSGIPPVDFNGPIDLKIQANDGELTGGTRFILNVTSGPAVLTPLVAQVSPEDQYFSYTVPADTFINLTGEPLSFSATLGNGLPLPSWLTFDSVTLQVSGQPPLDFNGAFNVLISASDGETSASSKFRLTIEAVPEAPVAVDLTTPWISEFAAVGSAVGFLSTVDSDQIDDFQYSLRNDANGVFKIVDDVLVVNGYLDSRVNGGVQHVTVRSTDATGFYVDRDFAIQVQSPEAGQLFSGVTPTNRIHVATTGLDAEGGGSADTPFATIQYAIDHATPGTAIMVHGGTYREALKISVSGTTDAPIWLLSADGIGAAEIRPLSAAETNAIDGLGIQNFVIEGFAITGTDTIGTYGINIVARNNGAKASFEDGFAGRQVANVVIKDNIITNWGIDGIHIAQSFNVQILHNTISGAHEQGIDFITGRRLVIANNHIDNITAKNAWKGLDQREYVGDSAITVKGGSREVDILNNFIGNTNGYGIKVGAPSGLVHDPIEFGLDGNGAHYVSYEADTVLVRGNTVLQSSGGAIDILAGTNVIVEQNLITHVRMIGFDRGVAGLVYGQAEQYLPLGTNLTPDNISYRDNVYKSVNLHNFPDNVHYDDVRNVRFNSNDTYSAADYAFAAGTNYNWTSSVKQINGSNGDNNLSGSIGNDYIQGKGGSDTMSGGTGDDIYIFDSNRDVAVEFEGGGSDTVVLTKAAGRYVMPEAQVGTGGHIENVTIARTGDTSVIGNARDNVITGNRGDDQLRGNDGSDTLFGGGGDDTLNGGAGRDKVNGGDGSDSLLGGGDDDVLEGGANRDRLDGGAGDDFLISYDADIRVDGGIGIDRAYFDRSTMTTAITLDISIFGQGDAGQDDLRRQDLADGTKIKNIEILALSSGSGDDHITGGYYADEIAAGAGDDYVNGHDGDDLIWGAAGIDEVRGGAGDDKIDGGIGSDFLYGGDGNDEITSNEVDGVLDGGAGVDTLVINREGSLIAFTVDIAASALHPDDFQILADGTNIIGFEQLTFIGGDRDDIGIGGVRNDTFSGGNGSDTFYGGEGLDRLQGGAEIDYLYGGGGGDVMVGGGAGDHLWGGAGNDTFKFIAGQTNGDIIYDFEFAGRAGGDKLSFSGYGPDATLTYNSSAKLWTVASADGLISESFTMTGVTNLIASDYILL